MKLAVALLTCDRVTFTERVVSALAKYNDLSSFELFYADDHSRDARLHEVVREHGYEPVFLNTGKRMGCSPVSDALVSNVRDRIGDDGIILYLQNDFECIRTLPMELILAALADQDVASVKLWEGRLGPNRIGPRTRLLRKAKWGPSNAYSEPVETSITGWGFNPQATRADTLCSIIHRATREHGMMKQSNRLGKLVVRPVALSFKHIGDVKTPRGIYRSKRRYNGHGHGQAARVVLPSSLRTVIASVTTTGRRIDRVLPAIESVLRGTVKPDRVELWLNESKSPVAPGVNKSDVPAKLASMPVDVRWCDNLGPATKLLPAMQAHPDEYVATFDDDVLYHPTWLAGLLDGAEQHPDMIVCYRARKIVLGRPYNKWGVIKKKHTGPDRMLVPTGVHGVLYPPDSLRDDAFDFDKLKRLAWANDDLWFSATAAMEAVVVERGGSPASCRLRGPRLSRRNCRGRNDVIIKALAEEFGPVVPWWNDKFGLPVAPNTKE